MRIPLNVESGFFHGMYEFVPDEEDPMYQWIHRFSAQERKDWFVSESLIIRASASSGVRFICRTDASELKLDYQVKIGSTQYIFAFDLWCDDYFLAHYDGNPLETPEGEWCVQLPSGEKTITLFFPNLTRTAIRSLELIGGSFAHPVILEKTLLVLGDSITQGFTGHFPSRHYLPILAKRMNVDFLNRGVGGASFAVNRILHCDYLQPDYILIVLGTNDWGYKSASQLQSDVHAYCDQVRKMWPSVPVWLVTPTWRSDGAEVKEGCELSFAAHCDIIEKCASQYEGFTILRGEKILPPTTAVFADEKIHPNDTGFALMADRIWENIRWMQA